MKPWIQKVYNTLVTRDGETHQLGKLIEKNLANVGRKYVSQKAGISRWKARKAIKAIRDGPDGTEDVSGESAQSVADKRLGEWEEEWDREQQDDKQTFNAEFSYAFDPEKEDGPEMPGDAPVTSEEDVRVRHNIDDTWVATRKKTKDWTVTMKLKEGGEERPITVQNYSINVTFERSERRENLRSFVDGLLSDVAESELPSVREFAYDRDEASYCAMIDMADPHIGKYAWAVQTGRDYNLRKAESIYRLAVDRLCERLAASGRSLHHIYVPIGHDGSHIDGSHVDLPQTTTRGTVQDADGKWQEISRVARRCYKYAVEQAVQIAPTKLLVVPGNHDERDAWYAGEILRERYSDHDNIEVLQDNKPTLEKTDKFGNNGFLWFHGKDQKLKDLPTFFANEYHKLWGQTKWREIVTGHKHKRTKHTVGDFFESDGAITRISPSLSAPDAWHYRKGYTSVVRGSQCLTWHRELGYDGDIPFNIIDEDRISDSLDSTL